LYSIFVAAPGSVIAGVLGLIFDKKKPLAIVSMLASLAFAGYIAMLVFG
jgi:hypothetical protein